MCPTHAPHTACRVLASTGRPTSLAPRCRAFIRPCPLLLHGATAYRPMCISVVTVPGVNPHSACTSFVMSPVASCFRMPAFCAAGLSNPCAGTSPCTCAREHVSPQAACSPPAHNGHGVPPPLRTPRTSQCTCAALLCTQSTPVAWLLFPSRLQIAHASLLPLRMRRCPQHPRPTPAGPQDVPSRALALCVTTGRQADALQPPAPCTAHGTRTP